MDNGDSYGRSRQSHTEILTECKSYLPQAFALEPGVHDAGTHSVSSRFL